MNRKLLDNEGNIAEKLMVLSTSRQLTTENELTNTVSQPLESALMLPDAAANGTREQKKRVRSRSLRNTVTY